MEHNELPTTPTWKIQRFLISRWRLVILECVVIAILSAAGCAGRGEYLLELALTPWAPSVRKLYIYPQAAVHRLVPICHSLILYPDRFPHDKIALSGLVPLLIFPLYGFQNYLLWPEYLATGATSQWLPKRSAVNGSAGTNTLHFITIWGLFLVALLELRHLVPKTTTA